MLNSISCLSVACMINVAWGVGVIDLSVYMIINVCVHTDTHLCSISIYRNIYIYIYMYVFALDITIMNVCYTA